MNNQLIRYVLTGDISVAKDEFVFDLMDSKPNRVTDNTFYISWSYIEFNQVLINVTETSGIVQVPVNRKGNLKQVSGTYLPIKKEPVINNFAIEINCLFLKRKIVEVFKKQSMLNLIFVLVCIVYIFCVFISTAWYPVEQSH